MHINFEPVKRATARTHTSMSDAPGRLASTALHNVAVAHFVGSVSYPSLSWDYAALHPKLYADTRAAGFLKTIDDWEIGRCRETGDIRVSTGVDSDAVTFISGRAAEVGRVQNRRARAIQLDDVTIR